MKTVYIAGPYSTGNPETNTITAIKVFHELRDLGYFPFCPQLSHYADLVQPRDYEDWMEWCLQWMLRCDALVRIPGHSPGADREVKLARKCNVHVFDSIDELIEAQHEVGNLG